MNKSTQGKIKYDVKDEFACKEEKHVCTTLHIVLNSNKYFVTN